MANVRLVWVLSFILNVLLDALPHCPASHITSLTVPSGRGTLQDMSGCEFLKSLMFMSTIDDINLSGTNAIQSQ